MFVPWMWGMVLVCWGCLWVVGSGMPLDFVWGFGWRGRGRGLWRGEIGGSFLGCPTVGLKERKGSHSRERRWAPGA